jgi:hypothetical protein
VCNAQQRCECGSNIDHLCTALRIVDFYRLWLGIAVVCGVCFDLRVASAIEITIGECISDGIAKRVQERQGVEINFAVVVVNGHGKPRRDL